MFPYMSVYISQTTENVSLNPSRSQEKGSSWHSYVYVYLYVFILVVN